MLLTARENLGSSLPHLALEELQPEAAIELLTSLAGAGRIQQESEIARQICQWLGYLPLGLEFVGRYLEPERDLSLKAMLSLLQKKRPQSAVGADTTSQTGVAAAFGLSWERLHENARSLSCLLSLFALADIPWSLAQLSYSNTLSSDEEEEIDLDFMEEARADAPE